VSFTEPHSPFEFPVEDRGSFAPSSFSVPPIGPEDYWQIPLVFKDLTEQQRQGIIAAYYSSVSFLDRNVGRVLEHLKRLDLEKDTIVVYTADHGYCLGHHGRFEKHCGYDPALRVPLIIRYPARFRPRAIRDFTEHIDLAPALLELTGARTLPVQHGSSLIAHLEGRRTGGRDHIFSEYLENEEVYVRDARWKLIYGSGRRAREDGYVTATPKPGRYVRLFDLREDPGEFTDVSAKYPKEVRRLAALALRRFQDTHPEARNAPGREIFDELDFFLPPRDRG
jgi:choline-sulfatase